MKGSVLVDGTVQAVWHSEVDRTAGRATVIVEHGRPARHALASIEAEAHRVADFWHPTMAERAAALRPIVA